MLGGWHAAFVESYLSSSMNTTVHELQLDQQPQPVLSCAHEFRGAAVLSSPERWHVCANELAEEIYA